MMAITGVNPMRQGELHRYHTLHLVLEHRLTGPEAAQSLNLSLRHVRRLLARLRQEGRRAVIHGNRGRPSSHRLAEATRQQVLTLARAKYAGLNTTHLTEQLQAAGLPVSRVTVHRLLRAAGVARLRRRRPPRHGSRRPRKAQAGLLVLWDGGPHAWLGTPGPTCCLVAALDDATGHLLPGAAFVPAEDTVTYPRLLRMLVGSCGIPVALYMDRHSIFRRNDDAWTLAEELHGAQAPTQVGRTLAALGIEAIFALSPQAKGRIERLWGDPPGSARGGTPAGRDHDGRRGERLPAGVHDALQCPLRPAAGGQRARLAARPPRRGSRPDLQPLHGSHGTQRQHGADTRARAPDPPGPGGRGYAKARVEVHQLLDGSWRIYHADRLIATPATSSGPPTSSLRRRHYEGPSRRWGDLFTEQLG